MQNIIDNIEIAHSSMLEGITYMLPKKPDAYNPSDFRPIVYSPTIHKLLNPVISDEVYAHCKVNKILTEKQKDCC